MQRKPYIIYAGARAFSIARDLEQISVNTWLRLMALEIYFIFPPPPVRVKSE